MPQAGAAGSDLGQGWARVRVNCRWVEKLIENEMRGSVRRLGCGDFRLKARGSFTLQTAYNQPESGKITLHPKHAQPTHAPT